MKKMLVLALLYVSASSSGFCADATNISKPNYGFQKYGKESLDSINGSGCVTLDGTKVTGSVVVNGSLKAKDSDLNSLQVSGQVELQGCVITNTTAINGSLQAENTKFQNDLLVASQKVVLRKCTAKSLTMGKVSGFSGKQIVELSDETNVTGPIVVESGKGEIWISSNSAISESQVTGAQIIRKN